jgi:hypothetical protein
MSKRSANNKSTSFCIHGRSYLYVHRMTIQRLQNSDCLSDYGV